MKPLTPFHRREPGLNAARHSAQALRPQARDPMTMSAIGIDVAARKLLARSSTPMVTPAARRWSPPPRGDVEDSAVKTLALIDRLLEGAAVRGLTVERVGVGIPEYVTTDGRITNALILPSLQHLPAATGTGIPILIDSDVRCAARAESRLGRGRGLSSLLFVIIGTGISCPLVIEGRLWAGRRGEAIALGELPVNPSLALRPQAPLTVEEQASGRAIGQILDGLTARDDNAAGTGGADEVAIVKQAGRIVARAVVSAVHLLDPGAVVMGGGLGASEGPFFGSLARDYAALTTRRPDPPPLLQTRLGTRAGLIGAGLLALRGALTDSF